MPWGNTGYCFSWHLEKFKKQWHFEIYHGSPEMGNHIMCNIWKTADRKAKQMKIWESRSSHRNSICRVIFRSGHLRSVWGPVHFATFPKVRYLKAGHYILVDPTVFIQVKKKNLQKVCFRRKYRLLHFLAICQVYGTLKTINLPQLDSQYPYIYVGFIWQKAKQIVKVPGPSVC